MELVKPQPPHEETEIPRTPLADNTAPNMLVLAKIIQDTIIQEKGVQAVDADLVNAVAWNVAISLPSSVLIPKAASLRIKDLNNERL